MRKQNGCMHCSKLPANVNWEKTHLTILTCRWTSWRQSPCSQITCMRSLGLIVGPLDRGWWNKNVCPFHVWKILFSFKWGVWRFQIRTMFTNQIDSNCIPLVLWNHCKGFKDQKTTNIPLFFPAIFCSRSNAALRIPIWCNFLQWKLWRVRRLSQWFWPNTQHWRLTYQ